MGYNGTIELIAGVKPANNGNFPMVNAKDVYVDDDTRLDAKLNGLDDSIDDLNAAVVTDSTLSQTGKPADAKAVGDAINNITIEVDATLSQSGKAADAKATGDAVGDLKTQLGNAAKITTVSYKSIPYHIEAGKEYTVYLYSGILDKMSTRETSGGENIDTIFSTTARAGSIATFTATSNAEFLRINVNSSNVAVLYIGESASIVPLTYINRDNLGTAQNKISDLADFDKNTIYETISGNTFASYPYEFKSGVRYYLEIISGQLESAGTRETANGNNIDVFFNAQHTAPYTAYIEASADAHYVRLAFKMQSEVRIYVADSIYDTLRNNSTELSDHENRIVAVETAVGNHEMNYTPADLITQKSYGAKNIGEYINKDVPGASSGNATIAIPVSFGNRLAVTASPIVNTYACVVQLIDTNGILYESYPTAADGITITIRINGYALITCDPTTFSAKLVKDSFPIRINTDFGKILSQLPQQSANGSEDSDFNAETCNTTDIYSYLDNLQSQYPNYITSDNMGADESGDYVVKRYVIAQRRYLAWQKDGYPAMYGWKSGGTIRYTATPFPRIGDGIYTSGNTSSPATYSVTAISNNSLTFTTSENLAMERDETSDIFPTLVYTLNVNGGNALYKSCGVRAQNPGTYSSISGNTLTAGGNTYTRMGIYDTRGNGRHQFVWHIQANEHGPTSDPRECAIVMCRMVKALCDGVNNPLLNFLRRYAKIVLIPVANPWGFDQMTGGRLNSNGVNLNRNYPTQGWFTVTDTDKGSHPASEIEVQYAIKTIMEAKADVGMSLHCLGATSTNEGNCHYAGVLTKVDMDDMTEIMNTMYNLKFSRFSDGNPETSSESVSYMRTVLPSGILLEMNAGTIESGLHTSKLMEANTTLVYQILYRMFTALYPFYEL